MNKFIAAAAASAALLLAFAFSANAEELHKDGLSTSGARLNYEATALPGGQLQIEITLECRQSKLEILYGVGAVVVINKAATPVEIKKSTMTCEAKGDAVVGTGKTSGKVIITGLTPADIGTKVFVLGRAETGKSSRTDGIMKKAEAALQKEIDKVTAG